MSKWLCILFLSLYIPVVHAGKHALVIGNSNYVNLGILVNPGNDAQDIGDALASIGFQVTPHFDLDKRAMKQAINRFAGKLGKGDTAVVYYSGHGSEYHGKNYLLPLYMILGSIGHLESEAVPLNYLMTALEDSGSAVNIVILDACRDSPQLRSLRSRSSRSVSMRSGGLASEEGSSGTLIAYAADAGKTASDGLQGERNSPYVKHLKREIIKPGQTIFQVFTNVRDAVRLDTRHKEDGAQEPTFYSKLNQTVCFSTCSETTASSHNNSYTETKVDYRKIREGKLLHQRYCEKCHEENGTKAIEDGYGKPTIVLAGKSIFYLTSRLNDYYQDKRDMPKKMKKYMRSMVKDEGINSLDELAYFYSNTQK